MTRHEERISIEADSLETRETAGFLSKWVSDQVFESFLRERPSMDPCMRRTQKVERLVVTLQAAYADAKES